MIKEPGITTTLSINAPDLQARLEAIKKSFYQQKLDEKIKPKKSDRLSWYPDWENPKIQVVNDSVSYVFYAFLGKLDWENVNLTQTNGKLFLMVKNEKDFYKAFYYKDLDVQSNKEIKEFNMDHFTGNLLLSSLQNGRNYLLDYTNGHLSDAYFKKGVLAVKKMQSNKGTISYWEENCQLIVRNCTYSTLSVPPCAGGGIVVTFSADCQWPQALCGYPFSLTDSDEQVICEDVWYPDPPIDPGEGGGGGGGGGVTTPDVFNQNINLENLSPCASSVMSSLMYESEGSVVAMIQKFSGEVPGYSWNLETGSLGTNTNATTQKISGGASTIVDVSKYSGGSDLALARTLLHEAVHAYLVSYFANNPILAQLSYPDMMVEWQKTTKPNLNAVQHIEMTIEFKNDIAAGLREYGDLHGVTFSTDAEKGQFYSDMAWGGLEATPAYQQLNTADKDRIQDTLNAEQYGTDRNGNPKSGKGNPSGC